MTTLPNLILGGAQKSGTTTMHRLLESHGDVYFPRKPQELHYFDHEPNYRKGLDWYARHFRAWNGEKVIAQTSPNYLYLPEVPQRIHEVLPDARSIFILRNPVDRAYSHYWNTVRYGWESESFEEGLHREVSRIAQGPRERRRYSYVDRGRYATQLERYAQLFPRDNILVVLLDELKANRSCVCQRIGEFLSIDPAQFALAQSEQSYNVRERLPRSLWLQRLVRRVRLRVPKIGFLMDRVNLKNEMYPPMNAETRRRLQRLFEPEMAELEAKWGLDLSRWRASSD